MPEPERYPPRPLGAFDDPFVDYGRIAAPTPAAISVPVERATGQQAPLEPRDFVDRPRRLIVDIPLIMAFAGHRADVRVLNLSAGGLLISMGGLVPPPIGAVVELGAPWLTPFAARVVRHAMDRSGRVEGAGLAFLPDARHIYESRGAHVLVFMPDGPARMRVLEAIQRAQVRYQVAPDLLTAATCFMHAPIPAVVLDPNVRGVSWVDLADALGLYRRATRVIALEDPAQPLTERPPWADIVTIEGLPAVLQKL